MGCRVLSAMRRSSPACEAADGFAHSLFICGDQVVHGGIDLPVDLLPRRIGVEPYEGLSNAFGKRGGGAVAGNKTFNLRVIEDHAYGLITYQCPLLIGQAGGNEVGWNMHQLRFDTDGGADDAKELVPGQHFIRRNVKRVPYGLPVAE